MAEEKISGLKEELERAEKKRESPDGWGESAWGTEETDRDAMYVKLEEKISLLEQEVSLVGHLVFLLGIKFPKRSIANFLIQKNLHI